MKYIFYIIVVLFFTGCIPPKLKTIKGNFEEAGVLEVSINDPLKIYAHPNDTSPYDEITFNKIFLGKYRGSIYINTTRLKEKLNPYKMYGGSSYSEGAGLTDSGLDPISPNLVFRVIKATPNYFEVLLNDTTREIGYIKKDERATYNSLESFGANFVPDRNNISAYLMFERWEDYLKRALFIYISNYDIYDSPNGKILNKISTPRADDYKVLEVKGNWMKVLGNKSGWLQWRKNNSPVIDVVLYTVE